MNQAEIKVPRFRTMTEIASTGLISRYAMRLMLKAGTLPGYYAGTRFYVNLDKLLEQLGAV